jgi:dihydrofolate synthase/folylpolyglutamate synthase
MRFDTLADWLAWQETFHAKSIDLGLDRIQAVYERMDLTRPAPVVITVGGTNGKGSCVAFLEAMLRSSGFRVGTYTSPHLLQYNERVTLDGSQATDDEFMASFDRVDRSLDDATLTYFEFGTLAAFDLMERTELDIAVLEVGLGGRLDAVNIIDADCSLITTIGLDHMDYLGPDRESIGREKAGIMRGNRPAVCGDREPPQSLLDEADRIGADLKRIGRDFDFELQGDNWSWKTLVGAAFQPRITDLPKPVMPGAYQLANAACCVQALACLSDRIPVGDEAIAKGLRKAVLPGRLQMTQIAGVEVILDVAHNPQAAASLASALDELPERRPQVAVFAQLKDKDHRGVVEALQHHFDHWYIAGLDGERGLAGHELAACAADRIDPGNITVCTGARHALDVAIHATGRRGRVVVFGSFHTVETVAGMVYAAEEKGIAEARMKDETRETGQ